MREPKVDFDFCGDFVTVELDSGCPCCNRDTDLTKEYFLNQVFEIPKIKQLQDQLTTANKRIEVLKEAINKSIKDYKSRKMTYGWHDLQNKMFVAALAECDKILGEQN